MFNAMQWETKPVEFRAEFMTVTGQPEDAVELFKEFIKTLPSFRSEYQKWYSESLVLIKQLLPDRLSDFIRLYEKPKNRKEISHENYVLEDYLQGLAVKRWGKEIVVGPDAGFPRFEQQLNILKSIEQRFENSLFDIAQLVQADLFDSELDAARELKRSGFLRAAGAMAGVVLERHLTQVCANHNLSISKKAPHISDLNDLLKQNNAFDTATWRFIQHLADIRNVCDHSKKVEPTPEQVEDLVAGVTKISKTVF